MALVAKRVRRGIVPQRRSSQSVHLPAPVGGLNTVSPASAMAPSDCLALYNLIPYQYGLRVRSGYREWCTNVGTPTSGTGLYDYGSPLMFHFAGVLGGPDVGAWTSNEPMGVRSVLGFTGSRGDGRNDRLWAGAPEGIYDVTYSTSSPTRVFTFPDTGYDTYPDDAGMGVGTTFINSNGDHYYLYCDGFHGYHIYNEKTQVWSSVTAGTGGSTDAWQIYSADPSRPLPDPSRFRFVMIWKNRVWLIPEDSGTAWYLEVGTFAGAAYPMPFSPRFKSGGELVGLFSWTVDGGAGVDDQLVGISRGGDVVIYAGTDPAIPGAFALRGIWWVGQVAPGRRIASQFGGDLFILSVVGCVPLSRLVGGAQLHDPNIVASGKVANLFNKLMTERSEHEGWCVNIHPTDNLLIVNVPPMPSQPGQQITMSLANHGWSQHLGVPIMCMETWRNKLFFGTADSKVCIHDGWVDGLTLGGGSCRPIDWGLQTSYQTLGDPSKKRVHMVRPYFMTDGTPPGVKSSIKFDFDLTPIAMTPLTPDLVPTAWDMPSWEWDVSGLWDDGIGTAGHYDGVLGMGSHASLIMVGTSTTQTTFVGFDAMIEKGGLL